MKIGFVLCSIATLLACSSAKKTSLVLSEKISYEILDLDSKISAIDSGITIRKIETVPDKTISLGVYKNNKKEGAWKVYDFNTKELIRVDIYLDGQKWEWWIVEKDTVYLGGRALNL